jgi:antirestriction protein ArdC
MEYFTTQHGYYGTLFHELGHSTGHEKRLDRPIRNMHGDAQYSAEELIAEMTAAFLCAHTGIARDDSLIVNHTAYVQHWKDHLSGDEKAVVLAAAKAQKAADFILDVKWEEEEEKKEEAVSA